MPETSHRLRIRRFFSDLYPGDPPGYLAVTAFKDEIPTTRWVLAADHDEAARIVEDLGRFGEVYFGIGLYTEPAQKGRGSAAAVAALPGLWLELDWADPAHKKTERLPPTEDDALALVAEFPLAPTLIVRSGHGAHVWWLFREVWEFESQEQHDYAAALSRRLQGWFLRRGRECGWEMDNTSDIARVLRPVGTWNRKREPVQVTELRNGGPRYNPSDFEAVLPTVPDAPRGAQMEPGTYLIDGSSMPRHDALRSFSVKLAGLGVPESAIDAALRDLRSRHTAPGGRRIDDAELARLAKSAAEKYYQAAALTSPSSLLTPIDWSDALTGEETPVPWIVPDYIAQGEAAILGGIWGGGKSIVALDLALSVASGEPWLDTLHVYGGPQPVLIVDEEQPERLVRHRLRRQIRGRGVDPAEATSWPITYFCQRGLNLADLEHRQAFFEHVDAHRPRLIIIDSLVRVALGLDGNDAGEMAAFFQHAVLPLTRDFGATVLLIHHVRKDPPNAPRDNVTMKNRLRGSTDIPAAVGTVFVLDSTDTGRTLHHVKCRWQAEQSPVGVEFEGDAGSPALHVRATGTRGSIDYDIVVLNALAEAGTEGLFRGQLQTLIEEAGSRDADRMTTKTLGRLWGKQRVRRRKIGHKTKYWMRELAPSEAE